jgi:hypothetical protein
MAPSTPRPLVYCSRSTVTDVEMILLRRDADQG